MKYGKMFLEKVHEEINSDVAWIPVRLTKYAFEEANTGEVIDALNDIIKKSKPDFKFRVMLGCAPRVPSGAKIESCSYLQDGLTEEIWLAAKKSI
jgi:hypothetical protein